MKFHAPCLALALAAGAANTVSAQHGAPDEAAVQTALEPSEMIGEVPENARAAAVQSLILSGWLESAAPDLPPGVIRTVKTVYARRAHRPIWTRAGAGALTVAKGSTIFHGVVVKPVDLQSLRALVGERFAPETAAETLAEADMRMTLAFLRMGAGVAGGFERVSGTEGAPETRPARLELATLIEDAASGALERPLDPFKPQHPEYAGLQTTLARYLTLRALGGWDPLAEGRPLELGDENERVPALRERLVVEGFMETEAREPRPEGEPAQQTAGGDASAGLSTGQDDGSDPSAVNVFDERLEARLKAFQRAHGLEDDGVLGPRTLEALNESVDVKINRIADSMHRWRRLGDPGQRFIWANIPSFRVEAWADGKRQLRQRSIVGRPDRPTPVFSDMVEYAVANPRWFVPKSIMAQDKLPKIQDDPAYLAEHRYTVVDRATGQEVSPVFIDWTDPEVVRNYRLIQSPGEENALGALKIIFPNQYSVYLHGTPGEHLFDEARRTFSSGCIRLEDPVAMAKWVARRDEALAPAELEDAIDDPEPVRLDVDAPIPVHVTYITVTMSDEGRPVFWRDVYDDLEGVAFVERLSDRPSHETAAAQ